MVAPVRRNDEAFRPHALREPAGHRQQDRVAERHHGLPHGLIRIVPLRDLRPALEQRRGKQPGQKIERRDLVPHSEQPRLLGRVR